MSFTVAVLKPDVARHPRLITRILHELADSKLRVVGGWRQRWTADQAAAFYRAHRDRPFFARLCRHVTAGEVEVWKVVAIDALDEAEATGDGSEAAITAWRRGLGPARPDAGRRRLASYSGESSSKRQPFLLRALYGQTDTRNGFHGADSAESARREWRIVRGGDGSPGDDRI